jgi:pimeloyl-ACP methyl ester carboxylesterase
MPSFKTSDGLNLNYTDDGAGLPVLCLAGLTRTVADFDYVAPHLSGNRLIRLDYRGRGASDWDENWNNYILPVECRDVVELLDHLRLEQVAILGTSRGGLNAMGLCASVPDRILGVALNDVGPELDPRGLSGIMTYLGRNPAGGSHEDIAAALGHVLVGFDNVPMSRWLEEAHKHYVMTDDGLKITYDPNLRKAVEAGGEVPDLWPFFDAMAGKPLACIRGAGSDLLSVDTLEKMQTHRPDMITATVPYRGHIPFLDEPESIAALHTWIGQMT